MSLAYIPVLLASLSGAKPEQAGLASGLVNTSYQVGSALGPNEAWLALRGLKTFPLRMARQCESAARVARFLESQLFGVTAHDPGTFIVVPVLLIAAAVLGCLIPARRATRIDPMTALRTQ